MVSVNWDDMVEGAEKADLPLPNSTYMTQIEKAEWGETKQNPRAMLTITLVVISGPEQGEKIWHRIVVDPAGKPFAVKRTMDTLNALGLTVPVLKSTSKEEQCNMLIGQFVEVDTEINDGYVNCKRFAPQAGGGAAATPPPAAAPAPVAAPPADAAPPPAAAPVNTPAPPPFSG